MFDCQGKEAGKNKKAVSLFHLNCVSEGKSYNIFSRRPLIKPCVTVSVFSWKSPMWTESGRG